MENQRELIIELIKKETNSDLLDLILKLLIQ